MGSQAANTCVKLSATISDTLPSICISINTVSQLHKSYN